MRKSKKKLYTSIFFLSVVLSLCLMSSKSTLGVKQQNTALGEAQDDYYVNFNATEEDYVNFSTIPNFTLDTSWSIVQRLKAPLNASNYGWNWFRGSAWQDKEGDIALKLNTAEKAKDQIVFWIQKNGWNSLRMDRGQDDLTVQKDVWYNIIVQFSLPDNMYKLYLDGELVDSLELGPLNDSTNDNPFFLGGQYCAPGYEKGDLYSESDISIAHLAFYQRTLTEQEIQDYEGTIDTTDEDLFFASQITNSSVNDVSENQLTGINGNSPEYIEYTLDESEEGIKYPSLLFIGLAIGLVATLVVIRKKK